MADGRAPTSSFFPPSLSQDERTRLAALYEYDILDTPPEVAFDRITVLASRLLKLPIATIFVVDRSRTWFKSTYGIEVQQVHRHNSFCQYVIQSDQVLVVPDLHQDPRYLNHQIGAEDPGARFFVGAPLVTANGMRIGGICLADTQPHSGLTADQKTILVDLAAIVMHELELRRVSRQVSQVDAALMEIAWGISAVTGQAFFDALTQHLSQTLQVDYALISLVQSDNTARTLAAWAKGQITENFTYALPGSPCQATLGQRQLCLYPEQVQAQFPEDDLLQEMGIESYVAAPFFAASGEAIGLVIAMHSQPLQASRITETLMLFCTLRITAELERQKVAEQEALAYQALEHQLTQQAQVETLLRQSEKRYASLLTAVPVGIFRLDAEGCCIYINPYLSELAGISLAEIDDTTWLAQSPRPIIYPEDHPRIRAAWETAFQQRQDLSLEHRIYDAQGAIAWVSLQAVVERDAAGEFVGYIGTVTDISNLKRAEATILHSAFHDDLTGLPNRTLLSQQIDLALSPHHVGGGDHYAVLFLDLDRFKTINESLGHTVGDHLLRQVAQRLQSRLQSPNLVARLGGDEFAILLRHEQDPSSVIQFTQELLADFQIPLRFLDTELLVNASIGLVLDIQTYQTATEVLRDADIAMSQAKAQGRQTYRIFNADMHSQAYSRLMREIQLREAIERDELMAFFQPIIDLKTQRLIGFEALARWPHPAHGYIPPDDFIPIAEEANLLAQLDLWMLGTACRQLMQWQQRFPQAASLTMSVNLSAQTLKRQTLLAEIDQILKETQLPGHRLTLELTEGTLISNTDHMLARLNQLKQRQIKISIDDFGTGYSSLSYLYRLPVDALKIDRSFVGQMEANNRNYQVVSTIITLSNQLGLAAVAEGIEVKQQCQWLQQMGCELGQGYLFARPLTAFEVTTRCLGSAWPLHLNDLGRPY